MARGFALASLAATAIGAGGCDTSGADATIGALDFYTALLNGQGAQACAKLTPATRVAVRAATKRPCAAGILVLSPSKAFLRGLKINNATVSGRKATVDAIPFNTPAANALIAHLSYVSGSWQLQEPLPGLASAPGGTTAQ
jgi:hypothetical protein